MRVRIPSYILHINFRDAQNLRDLCGDNDAHTQNACLRLKNCMDRLIAYFRIDHSGSVIIQGWIC